ncbi:hypothetical protein FJP62_05510 [Pantoea vagans]|nr:hypothetical protein FJP62_05510 [Pantoea vagans]
MIPGQPDTGCSLSDDIFPRIYLPARLLMNIRRFFTSNLIELPALKPYQFLGPLRKTPTSPDDSFFTAITIIPGVPESQRCWRACVTLRLMMPVRSWVNASCLPLLAMDSVSRPVQ